MEEGCMSLIDRLKLGSELQSTLSIGKLFQRFMINLWNNLPIYMTRTVKQLDLTELLQKNLKIL